MWQIPCEHMRGDYQHTLRTAFVMSYLTNFDFWKTVKLTWFGIVITVFNEKLEMRIYYMVLITLVVYILKIYALYSRLNSV